MIRGGKLKESCVTIAHNINSKIIPKLQRSSKYLMEQVDVFCSEYQKQYRNLLTIPTGKNLEMLLMLFERQSQDEFSEISMFLSDIVDRFEQMQQKLAEKTTAAIKLLFQLHCDLKENITEQNMEQTDTFDKFDIEANHSQIDRAVQQAFGRRMRLQLGSRAELVSSLVYSGSEVVLSVRECIYGVSSKKFVCVPFEANLLEGLLDIVISGFDHENRTCNICIVRIANANIKLKQYTLSVDDKCLPKNTMLSEAPMLAGFPSIGAWNCKIVDSDRGYTVVRISDHSVFIFEGSVKEEAILKLTKEENHSLIESFAICVTTPCTSSSEISGIKVMLAVFYRDGGSELQTSYGKVIERDPKFRTDNEPLKAIPKRLVNKDVKFAETSTGVYLLVAGLEKRSTNNHEMLLIVYCSQISEISPGKHHELSWQTLEFSLQSTQNIEPPKVRINMQQGSNTTCIMIDLGEFGAKRLLLDKNGQITEFSPGNYDPPIKNT